MAIWKILKDWFTGNAFAGQGIVFKSLRFLNLMEDKAVKFSLTGMQLWVTTWMNIQTQIASHDHITMGIAAASNGMAMVAHGVKRGQILKADSGTDDDDGTPDNAEPPWKGEGP